MNLLAIDTSTDACSVGLLINSDILLDHRVAAQRQGSMVLPMVNGVLAEAGITAKQLDAVAYGRGPGSFTGVRIGVAATQGIALGADIGVVGISTLQSIAQGCLRQYGDSHVAVSVDARMDEVYFAAFIEDENQTMQTAMNETVCAQGSIQALPHRDSGMGLLWHWAGSGADRYKLILNEQFSVPDAAIRSDRWPHAQDLLSLGSPRVLAGELTPPEYASPVYLRDKVAQTTQERMALNRN
ncbi:MAG: tRNA (adenosine(37)-N6)-threonylcarbamoyltransferase complex dimerization subunit type 1 TsaB [Granulosicoccus sp.]